MGGDSTSTTPFKLRSQYSIVVENTKPKKDNNTKKLRVTYAKHEPIPKFYTKVTQKKYEMMKYEISEKYEMMKYEMMKYEMMKYDVKLRYQRYEPSHL